MIYLDNSATTRTIKEAADAAYAYMTDEFFNPSAAYSPAVAAERAVNRARADIAAVMGVSAEELIFTSGGTESNNTAIFGALRTVRGGGNIVIGAAEHPSVFEAAASLSKEFEVREAPSDKTGAVDIEKLAALIDGDTRLISIMQVNNETGAINDTAAVYRLIKRGGRGALLHVDGVQGFLKVPFDARGCDMYTLSGHKFHGPKGVGALYVKKGTRFAGGQIGGGQEQGLRSGTLNTPGIIGMGAAAKHYSENAAAYRKSMMECKLRLARGLLDLPDTVINGPEPERGAPHILNVSFLGVRGEVLLHALEEKQIYVSTGSACSAKKRGKNRILTAMGIDGERREGAIRFSLCPFNTAAEMDEAVGIIADQLTLLRRFKRR